MNDVICRQCGNPNRATARFCAHCGARLGAAAPSAPPAAPGPGVAERAREVAVQVAQAAGPVVRQAAQAAAPVAREAAQRSWHASRQGMGWLARLVTAGGRAAYTEIVSPQPLIAGQVISPPMEDWVPIPVEAGAIVFVACLLLGWLVFLLPQWWQEALFILALVFVLLVLNFAGLRRPAFTRLTWSRLLRRAKQVPRLRVQVREHTTGQAIYLTVVGPRSGAQLFQGADLLAYGTRYSRGNEVRAWKLDMAGPAVIVAPRLVPLSAALLLVPVLLGLAWLIEVIVSFV
jgi:hypothetical protein